MSLNPIMLAASFPFSASRLLVLPPEVFRHIILTIGASILSFKPFSNTLIMEPVQAWQEHEHIVYFILAHADCACFILL